MRVVSHAEAVGKVAFWTPLSVTSVEGDTRLPNRCSGASDSPLHARDGDAKCWKCCDDVTVAQRMHRIRCRFRERDEKRDEVSPDSAL